MSVKAMLPAFESGISLIEMIVSISILAVMASVIPSRVEDYQEQAEKTAMVGVVGAIQTSLTMQYGRILTRGKPSDVEVLKADNPMYWLQQKPTNYAGEFDDPTPLTAEPGNWIFDRNSRDLIYVLKRAKHFKPGADGKQWIRYHVVVHYEHSRLPSLQDAPPELTGIIFEPVEPYSWF